jgi:hypothetical protein
VTRLPNPELGRLNALASAWADANAAPAASVASRGDNLAGFASAAAAGRDDGTIASTLSASNREKAAAA